MTVPRALLCLSLLFLSNASFAASTPIRQSVLSTATRCSIIADSHQWLDCFYGSAQQMREALKLAPAPGTQIELTQNPPTGGSIYDAGTRVSILTAAVNCGNLNDDRKWLNCYYASGDPMRMKLGLQPFSPNRTANALPGGLDPRSPDGLTASSIQSSKQSNVPTRFPVFSSVKSYSLDQRGMLTVVLTNGQMWRQISGDTNYVGQLHVDAAVTISRGAIGSYNLRIDRHPQYFKVRRLL